MATIDSNPVFAWLAGLSVGNRIAAIELPAEAVSR